MTPRRPDDIISMPEVIAACAALGYVFDTDNRSREQVQVRAIMVGAIRDLAGNSLPEIGKAMGRNFHSTAHGAHDRWRAMHPDLRRDKLKLVRAKIAAMRAEVNRAEAKRIREDAIAEAIERMPRMESVR